MRVTIHDHAGLSLKRVSCAAVTCRVPALTGICALSMSARRQNRSKVVGRGRVEDDSGRSAQHARARMSASQVME